ncbi:hypothetical protein DSO57_1017569 [Entomophthora muscae]|uniref:Uncharacterized protein n=1 Tax=Entomophthora muscae TaxID=34485 RepID=A0ACC2TFK1_9FUNG|nr:hypothetical protein DSO57_1017569 [Entomophthora muscae]
MLRRFVTLRSLQKVISTPRNITFSTKGYHFQKSPSEISFTKADDQQAEAKTVPSVATSKTEDDVNDDSAYEKEVDTSGEVKDNYDPDWYIHNDEDDLPLPYKEAQGFTPRWLKSSQENTDDNYHDSKLTPSELSKDLFEKFFYRDNLFGTYQAMSDSTRRFVKACQPYDTSIPSVLSLEGEMDDEWIVLDAGKTILHFMTAGAREKYKIEDIWSDLRDSNLEILQKLSSTSDVEAKKELLQRLQENMTNSWEQNVEADPLFESEEDLKSHLEK